VVNATFNRALIPFQLVILFACSIAFAAPNREAPGLRITGVAGLAEYKVKKENWRTARQGDIVPVNSIVTTDPEGRIDLVSASGVHIRLLENSEMKVLAASLGAETVVVGALAEGAAIVSRAGALVSRPKKFSVRSGTVMTPDPSITVDLRLDLHKK
jgi:hypothetical protein